VAKDDGEVDNDELAVVDIATDEAEEVLTSAPTIYLTSIAATSDGS